MSQAGAAVTPGTALFGGGGERLDRVRAEFGDGEHVDAVGVGVGVVAQLPVGVGGVALLGRDRAGRRVAGEHGEGEVGDGGRGHRVRAEEFVDVAGAADGEVGVVGVGAAGHVGVEGVAVRGRGDQVVTGALRRGAGGAAGEVADGGALHGPVGGGVAEPHMRVHIRRRAAGW